MSWLASAPRPPPSPPCHLLFIFGIRPHRFACITYVPVTQSESLAHATTGLATLVAKMKTCLVLLSLGDILNTFPIDFNSRPIVYQRG